MTSRITSDTLHLSMVSSPGNTPSARRAGDLAPGFATKPLAGDSTHTGHSIARQTADKLYVPEHYEAGYAYPLIVWLTSPEKPQADFRSFMRKISDRNYFGVAVSHQSGEHLEDNIVQTVVSLRRRYHIHSERICLAGVGNEAVAALQTGLARPEWFAGVVALSADLPEQYSWLSRFDALRGKRVLLGAGRDDAAQMESVRRTQRLLWSAGLAARACSYDVRDRIDDGVLREIDRWMMQSIEEAVTV